MTTTKIYLPTHIAEYCLLYANEDGVVSFPRGWDINHTINDLISKRPVGVHEDGNVVLALPDRHGRGGKNPLYYNYLTQTAQHLISQRLEKMFWQHVHDIMFEEKDERNIDYINTAYAIIDQWHITGISVDAIIKHYYRYRINMRKKRAEFQSLTPKICPLY